MGVIVLMIMKMFRFILMSMIMIVKMIILMTFMMMSMQIFHIMVMIFMLFIQHNIKITCIYSGLYNSADLCLKS